MARGAVGADTIDPGGLASLFGSVLGAAFLIILPDLLSGLDVWQVLVYGVIMGLTMLFIPFG